jgi:hypothetical protein
MAEGIRSGRYLFTAARRHVGADDALREAVGMAVEMHDDLFVLERLAAGLSDPSRRAALEVVEILNRGSRTRPYGPLFCSHPTCETRNRPFSWCIALLRRRQAAPLILSMSQLGSHSLRIC